MKKTLASLPAASLAGARVAVRVDFNVPLDDTGSVSDPIRIERTIPTIELLRNAGARVILLAHFGRPKGSVNPDFTLAPVGEYLTGRMGAGVSFLTEPVGQAVKAAVDAMANGEVLLLENTRFLPGETGNDERLGAEWADLTDLFVNDAFGAAHRAHASTDALPRIVRSRGGQAVAGLLMERELAFLGGALESPKRPFVAILGGAKISGKIEVIEALLPKVDALLIGGAMANTFWGAMGLETGNSLVEEDRFEVAQALLEKGGDRLVLPVDCVVAEALGQAVEARVVDRADVQVGDIIGDIGTATIAAFSKMIREAETVLWNGPMGVFEMPPFARGTFEVAQAAADRAQSGGTVIIGGGDSAAAVETTGLADQMTHISTGGGASLVFLAGKVLPGVAALSDATQDLLDSDGQEANDE